MALKILIMKKLVFIFFFYSVNLFSQNYVLDTSFGDGGTKKHINNTFYPKKVFMIGNDYYFISSNALTRVLYNGDIDTSFGTNGKLTLSYNGGTFSTSDYYLSNDKIFVFGKYTLNSNESIFVSKININGTYDTSFGDNGIKVIDFGENELLNNVEIDAYGNLYCVGSKRTVGNTGKLIYFKLDSNNGNILTSFDINQFKELNYPTATYTDGCDIKKVGNDYFLFGVANIPVSYGNLAKLVIYKIDENGTLKTSFGNSGSEIITLYESGSNVINDIQIENNLLYVNYNWSWSWTSQDGRLLKYDLANNTTVFNIISYYNFNFILDENYIYIAGIDRCIYGPCYAKFILKRLFLNGISDSNFGNNGEMKFEIPPNSWNNNESRSSVVYKDFNSKILLGGYTSNGINGFSTLRLQNSSLGFNDEITENLNIYPNPFEDFIYIDTDKEIEKVSIYQMDGKLVAEPDIEKFNSELRVDLSSINTNGVYFLKLTDENGINTINKIVR